MIITRSGADTILEYSVVPSPEYARLTLRLNTGPSPRYDLGRSLFFEINRTTGRTTGAGCNKSILMTITSLLAGSCWPGHPRRAHGARLDQPLPSSSLAHAAEVSPHSHLPHQQIDDQIESTSELKREVIHRRCVALPANHSYRETVKKREKCHRRHEGSSAASAWHGSGQPVGKCNSRDHGLVHSTKNECSRATRGCLAAPSPSTPRSSMGKLNGRKGISKKRSRSMLQRLVQLQLSSPNSHRNAGGRKPALIGTPMAPTHVPQKLGSGGGARQKVDLDAVSPRSKAKLAKQRVWNAAHYAKTYVAVNEVSEAVLADPTEAWRTKVTGHVNKYPDRARQRAAAELAAALPKNPALRGPALAAFLSHPEGKRAAAAMDIEAPVYTVLMCGQWLSYACTMYRWSVWSAVYV